MSQPVDPTGTEVGEPAAVQLLGEGVEGDHQVHLDADQRVEGEPELVLVGRAQVGRREHRDALVLPDPVADPGPAALDVVPRQAGLAVGAQDLVGGEPGVLGGRDHAYAGLVDRLAVLRRGSPR